LGDDGGALRVIMHLHVGAAAELVPSRHCFKLVRGVMVCGVLGVGYEAVSSNNLMTDGTEDHGDPVGQG